MVCIRASDEWAFCEGLKYGFTMTDDMRRNLRNISPENAGPTVGDFDQMQKLCSDPRVTHFIGILIHQ
jgi:hypothetical protein